MTATARAVRRARRRVRQPRQVRHYLGSAASPRLHLGAGHNRLGGWLNTDRDPEGGAVHLDAARRFPLPTGSLRYVFSEHLIEHLPYDVAAGMLAETHRVLAPGGRVRVATPDLAALASLLTGEHDEVGDRYAAWLAESYFPRGHGPAATFAVNQVMRAWGHRFVYDFATLRATLEAVGFADVTRHGFRRSDDPALVGLEDHGVADGNEDLTRFETLVVEAVRA